MNDYVSEEFYENFNILKNIRRLLDANDEEI